jgi:transposase
MHDEANRARVAELHADGNPRAVIAEEFEVHVETVSSWLQREDIKAEVDKILRDRTHRILRKVDTQIETLLARIEKLTLKELLDIRKEFLPDRKEISLNVNKTSVLEELWAAAAENPEAAAALLGHGD